MTWLNRVGLLLNFISFWLVAPEVLGEHRLKMIRQVFVVGLKSIPVFFYIVAASLFYSILAIVSIVPLWMFYPQLLENKFVGFSIMILATLLGAFLSLKLSSLLKDKFIKPILNKLADDEKLRRRLLLFGTLMFTLGFLCQMLATF